MPGTSRVIAIAGPSCAGKTLLAERLVQELAAESALLLSMDAYYADQASLPESKRASLNFDHPDALDWPLLLAHVESLRAGRAAEVPCYDFTCHTRLSTTRRAIPRPIILLEGILALHDPAIRACCALKVYVDAPHEVCRARRLIRDQRDRGRTEESIRNQYETTVRPMADEYVFPQQAHADLVINGEGSIEAGTHLVMECLKRAGLSE